MKKSNRNNHDIIENIMGMIPFLFILTMLIFHLIIPAKTFSTAEMRYLVQLPSFNIEKVLNGSYGTRVESYFSDQFPFRNFWVDVQAVSNNVLFKGFNSFNAEK